MRRRAFIAGLTGAVAWPLSVEAQQVDRVRRIAVMMSGTEDESRARGDLTALRDGLQRLGWSVGRNLHIDIRWGIFNAERARVATAELLTLAPDVIIANTTAPLTAAHQATLTIPIVFTVVYEPVAQGFVQSLAHPGGNITGFANVEPSVGGKWLELLKQFAPRINRVAFIFNPEASPYSPTIYRSVKATASGFSVDTLLVPIFELAEIEPAMMTLSRDRGCGLIVPPDAFFRNYRGLIVELAARYQLPAIYGDGFFPGQGGLVSYGANLNDQFRKAATYVDRILKGEKPGDLPVQQPTKFDFVINLKTAKALGLTIPETLLATADEVIQ